MELQGFSTRALVTAILRATDTPVSRAARRYEPVLRRHLLKSIRIAQDAVPMTEVEELLGVGHIGTGGVLYLLGNALSQFTKNLVGSAPFSDDSLRTLAPSYGLPGILNSTILAGATSAEIKGITMVFDAEAPEVLAWAESNAARLVKSINADTRAAIRHMVIEGIESGAGPRATAQMIRQSIGLLPRDAKAVTNYRAKLIKKGVAKDVAQKRAVRYAEKLRKSRAMTIARTETMRASNAGQRELWNQAQQQGYLSGQEEKVWITADPCPICAPLEGETVKLNEEFSIGEDPPAHPNCRCTMGLVQ